MTATRGGMARARVSALAIAIAAVLSACGGTSKVEQTPRVVQVGSFVGEASPATGSITITPTGVDPVPMGLTFRTALSQIPIHQNTIWGDADEGAVEMRTVSGSFHNYAEGCGGTTGSPGLFQADVEIHSGFRAHQLKRIYLEITYVDTGNESCLSVPSPTEDLSVSNYYGLFAYPDITTAQGSSTATWTFSLPDSTNFLFQGRLWAELVELSPPTTSSTLAAGTYASAQTMTLTCADNAGGDGCANTYYSVDYAGTTTYTAPIYPSGSHTICYWSDDLRGNTEAPTCGTYSVTAATELATYDAALGVPRCSGFGAPCDSNGLASGRGSITGIVENHAPNTLDGCADGTQGTAGAINNVVLTAVGGGLLAPGSPVALSADVTPRNNTDAVDVFWATTTVSPSWTLLGTVAQTTTGQQILTLPFTLPAGATAIRTHLGPTLQPGSACGQSGTDDQDDLVFLPAATPHGTQPPTVSMSAPTPNDATRIEGSVLLTATASDDRAVSSVEFFWRDAGAGGPWHSIGVDHSPPWAIAWDTTTPDFGTNSLQFYAAATDSDGNVVDTSGSPVAGSLWEVPAMPVVTSPTGGTYSRTSAITVTVSASKPHGVAAVDLYADGTWIARQGARAADCTGVSVPCTSGISGPTYTFGWTPGTTWSTAIPHKVYARAKDFRGVTAQSGWVTLNFN